MDATPLLRTKLHAPAPRADRVHRQRLFERLDAGRRTEGWIADLQMAALSLRGRDDVSAFIAALPAATASSSATSPSSKCCARWRGACPTLRRRIGNRTEAIGKAQGLGWLERAGKRVTIP